MKLDELIEYLKYKDLINFKDVEITGISYNSQTTKKGDIFICLTGEHTDGHKFAQSAIDSGAVALLVEHKIDGVDVPQVQVDSTRLKIADIADRFYSNPSKGLNLIGVTGTNGKTTVTHLIQKILEQNNQKCALIGTLGYKLSSTSEYRNAKHTTPQAPELQATLRMIKDIEKIDNVVMEVSSHALDQKRVQGIEFKVGGFTNLTQDHLDYHKTMDKYLEAKQLLLKQLKGNMIVNIDDEYGKQWLDKYDKCLTLGKKGKDYKIVSYKDTEKGTMLDLSINGKDYKVETNLRSTFNVYNYLTSLAFVNSLGFSIEDIIKVTNEVYPPKGRCEQIKVGVGEAVVDYAHTPDAVEKIIDAFSENKKGRIITVVGCGGDRDPIKRPIMGNIASRKSDYVIFTSDNPRTEDPNKIMDDIIAGVKTNNYEIEIDRKKAIVKALDMIREGDVVLLLGKGHEDYQILGHEKVHLDDAEEVRKYINCNK